MFFLQLQERPYFQADYFIAIDETLRKDAIKDFSFSAMNVEAIPKPFLRSWIDPSLAGVDREAMLNWIATSLEETQPLRAKLKVTRTGSHKVATKCP